MTCNKISVGSFMFSIVALVALSSPANLFAQSNWASYQLVPMTVYEKKPMKITRWVDETVTEKKQVTSYKPIWQTEKRERKQVVYKPVKETVEREEKVILRKPVVETMYRDRTVKETTYETVTKYRDQEYTVREPVMETEMRTEKYTVKKPVTKKLIEVTKTTTYKPVVDSETRMVPTQVPVIQLGTTPDPDARPKMQMLELGYYTNPETGQTVFRKRGLHWVQPSTGAASVGVIPALVPQQYGKLSFVPETVEKRNPIEITRYVEEEMTREVPVEVEKMVERTETRRVPYEVKVPKTTITTEQIPYKRTTYKEEVVTRKVPYTRSTLKKIETIEPYEVEVPRWITETKEVEVPKTVRRKVEYEIMQDVPKVVMMKIPLDICGNPLAMPMPVQSPVSVSLPAKIVAQPEPNLSAGFGTTLTRRVEQPSLSSDVLGKSVIEKAEASSKTSVKKVGPEPSGYRGTLTEKVETKQLDETSATSIVVPDTTPSAKSPGTSLKSIEKSKSVDETSSFYERSGSVDEITSSSQIRNKIPGASQWRSEKRFGIKESAGRRFVDNPFGEEWAEDTDVESGAATKTLIETSEEVKKKTIEIDLPGATKPDASLLLEATGDEAAADKLFKSAIELNAGT